MLELRHVIDQTGFDMVDYAKIESEIVVSAFWMH